jgi:polar amino acid transport system permease protein
MNARAPSSGASAITSNVGKVGFAEAFLNLAVMRDSLPAVAAGFVVTVELAVLIVISGLCAGLLVALLRTMGIRPLNWLIVFVVDLLRALPPLVIIVMLYIGAPAFDMVPSGFLCTWLSLSLVLTAFAEEIYWAGITAVPRGQWEAGRSTGLGAFATLVYVVLPQALRMVIAPLTNRTIAITKGTALGSVVAVSEILSQSSSAMSLTFNPSPLTLGALAYLVLFLPVVVAGRFIERRFGQHPTA